MGRARRRAIGVAARINRRFTARARVAASRGGDEAGLTLIELVVAMAFFAIVITGIAAMTSSGLTLARNNRNRSIAANLASEQVDSFRAAPFDAAVDDLGLTTTTETVNGVDYDVIRELSWVDQESDAGACDVAASGSVSPRLLRVVVSVEWAAMGAVEPVRSETVLAPPIGAFDPTLGNIAVRVFDREAGPGYGHPVTVSGPDNPPQQVTINDNGVVGCAFFAGLTPGSYTVTMGTASFVDRKGVASPSQTITVASGTVSSVQFDYDRAATLSLGIFAPAGGNIPADVPLTIGNNQILPLGTKVVDGSGTNRSLPDLFPFADGYQVWAGACADADPEGIDLVGGAPYWSGAVRPPALATDPGVVTTGTVSMETLQVDVTRSGAPVPSVNVVAVHPADDRCESGETLDLGTTDSSGQVRGALPFGTWEIQVSGETPASAWPTAVNDPTSTPPTDVVVEVAP